MQNVPPCDEAPLAERLRPTTFVEFVGQEDIWFPGSPLYELCCHDRFHSLIFWGPPGTGKTTLAQIIGDSLGRETVWLSATRSGVKDIRQAIDRSVIRQNHGEKGLLVFLDEIHRLSKNQQDCLLPAVEKGSIKLIGATTENPSFEVNHALLSRSLTFGFKKHSAKALVALLERASAATGTFLDDKILQALVNAADGDARKALNLFEALAGTGERHLDPQSLEGLMGKVLARYDKNADQHYDLISAMIKSIRSSDPDAAVYYLACMLEGGEDPLFIARRLVIAASEDVGNANPTALLLATSAQTAVHQIGMPESRILLSQVATYLAASPKSNRAYLAINEAMAEVAQNGVGEVPMHLRNAPTQFMKEMGYGKGYAYAHDEPEKSRQMCYLPDRLRHKVFYRPSDAGTERQLKENLKRLSPSKPSKH